MQIKWNLPSPFCINVTVTPDDLDGFGHVNNVTYIHWLERCAWAHAAEAGLTMERCKELKRGMAVHRTEVTYLAAAHLGEQLVVGNWITSAGRLRAVRHYEIFRVSDGERLLEGKVEFVCINLETEAPTRFPVEFVEGYPVLPAVAEAIRFGRNIP